MHERVIKAIERLAEVLLVHIRSMVKETCNLVADLGGGEGRVLALKITICPHDLRVADNIWTRRSGLQLYLVDMILYEAGGLKSFTYYFSNKTQ